MKKMPQILGLPRGEGKRKEDGGLIFGRRGDRSQLGTTLALSIDANSPLRLVFYEHSGRLFHRTRPSPRRPIEIYARGRKYEKKEVTEGYECISILRSENATQGKSRLRRQGGP